jgi:hypothetical protein
MTRPLVPEDLRRLEYSGPVALAWVARARAIAAKSYHQKAVDWLADNRAPAAAQRIFQKVAVPASDSSMVPPGISLGDWTAAPKTPSAFYTMLPDMVRLPLHSRVGMSTTSPTGAVVAEGKAAPVSRAVIANVLLTPAKAVALIVLTDELLLATDESQSVFNRELEAVINATVDAAVLADIGSGIAPVASSAPMADVRANMATVNSVGSLARPYWVTTPLVAGLGATLTPAKGGAAFADVTMTGGTLAGAPLLISSGCPANSLYLIDASGIAANAAPPEIEPSSVADIEMSTTPTGASDVPTAVAMTSLWQTNAVALRATAVFAIERLRTSAIAIVNNISATTWAP